MSKSLLITGGAASGKSRWAATYFSACDYVLYLKAGGEVDSDTLRRIEFSNHQNGVEWDIVTSEKKRPLRRNNRSQIRYFRQPELLCLGGAK